MCSRLRTRRGRRRSRGVAAPVEHERGTSIRYSGCTRSQRRGELTSESAGRGGRGRGARSRDSWGGGGIRRVWSELTSATLRGEARDGTTRDRHRRPPQLRQPAVRLEELVVREVVLPPERVGAEAASRRAARVRADRGAAHPPRTRGPPPIARGGGRERRFVPSRAGCQPTVVPSGPRYTTWPRFSHLRRSATAARMRSGAEALSAARGGESRARTKGKRTRRGTRPPQEYYARDEQ